MSEQCSDCGMANCAYHDYEKWRNMVALEADKPCLNSGQENCRCFNCEVFDFWENVSESVKVFLYGLPCTCGKGGEG